MHLVPQFATNIQYLCMHIQNMTNFKNDNNSIMQERNLWKKLFIFMVTNLTLGYGNLEEH
jgi:hypothetical protein